MKGYNSHFVWLFCGFESTFGFHRLLHFYWGREFLRIPLLHQLISSIAPWDIPRNKQSNDAISIYQLHMVSTSAFPLVSTRIHHDLFLGGADIWHQAWTAEKPCTGHKVTAWRKAIQLGPNGRVFCVRLKIRFVFRHEPQSTWLFIWFVTYIYIFIFKCMYIQIFPAAPPAYHKALTCYSSRNGNSIKDGAKSPSHQTNSRVQYTH